MGGTEAGELRALLRCIFSEQKKVDADNMPSNWGSATISFRNYVFQQVYLKFPCLRLCRSDWKVSQIAGTTYSSWKTHGKQKTKTVKAELSDVKIQIAGDLELNCTSGDEPARAAISESPAKRPFVSDSKSESPFGKRPRKEESSGSLMLFSTSATLLGEPTGVSPLANVATTTSMPVDDSDSVTAIAMVTVNVTSQTTELSSSITSDAQTLHVPPPLKTPTLNLSRTEDSVVENGDVVLGDIIDPLFAAFGAPSGPNIRRDWIANPAAGGSKGADATAVMKKVTKSTSAKNLCYIDYLKNHEPITCAAFDVYYKGLSRPEIKKWVKMSKDEKTRMANTATDDN